jgi:4-alpha-glucanotransferase
VQFSRSSGILLHPSSLPGPHGIGDFGPSSYYFIDWLGVAGQTLWQILPLVPVGFGNSPYVGLSAFAGEPMLISLEDLVKKGWLDLGKMSSLPSFDNKRVNYQDVNAFKMKNLRQAAGIFFSRASSAEKEEFGKFSERNKSWLNDYALFMALKEHFGNKEWRCWDKDIARRDPSAIKRACKALAGDIRFWEFCQWCFYSQWTAVKKYANDKGIQIIGDIPVFVAYQSADVWSQPGLFHLDDEMRPTVVSGVPPDYFSETGQRWGNPLYRWDEMERRGYDWWIERIKMTLCVADIVRIDHFLGFDAYWEIPASEKTAVHGKWVEGPKAKFFHAVREKLGKLPIIAEDLGLVTPGVIALRDQFDFPGMKVLQFAFAGGPKNPFLPHNYHHNVVAYTGTHDNDTTLGWFASATEREKAFVEKYVGISRTNINWELMRVASYSVADRVVFPFQDVLGYGTEARMNLPGKSTGNWEWRFAWEEVKPEHAEQLYELTALSNRCPADRLKFPSYPEGKTAP